MASLIAYAFAFLVMFVMPGFSQAEKMDRDLTGYRLVKLDLTGSTVFPRERLIVEFPIRVGDKFNRSRVNEGLERIKRIFEQAGYIDLRYTPWMDVDSGAKTVSLSFDLWQGRQYTVRRIDLVGNSSLRDSDVRSAIADLGLEEGKTFRPGLLDETVRVLNKLLGMERLSSRDCQFTKPADFPGMVDITITLHVH